MSIVYCPACDKNIDTDLDAEHFDMLHTMEGFDTYLADSSSFEEFYQKADTEIAEHILQTTGEEPLTDEVKDFAKELWDEYTDGQHPF